MWNHPGTNSDTGIWQHLLHYVNCNAAIYPGGQSAHKKEIQFRLTSSGTWDATNDWSYQGMTTSVVKRQNIPVYEGTTKVWGSEPASSGTSPTVNITSPTSGTTFST